MSSGSLNEKVEPFNLYLVMKKFILLVALVLGGLTVQAQISPDSSSTGSSLLNEVGSGVFGGGGDSKAAAYTKINNLFDTLHTFFVVDTVTNALDSTEIDDILGISPATAPGKKWYLVALDSMFYTIISDGTNWYVDSLSLVH